MTVPVPGDHHQPGSEPDGPAHRRLPVARLDRPLVVGVVVWLLAVVPLVVALVAIGSPRWFPIADLAQSELRVRDVGTADTPLIGLAGRIGEATDPGSHPGPLSFWLLAPLYRLLGATSAALASSTVVLHAVAMAASLWLAARRGGTPLVAAVGAASALLVHAYGPAVYFEPWNPYLPVSWWVLFLLAVWSVVDDDLVGLPVAVVAGSFCAQTHLPYVGLVGGSAVALGAAVSATVVVAVRRSERGRIRRYGRWVGASALLGLVLWTPTLVDEVGRSGNLTKIRTSLAEPGETVTGFVRGTQEVLRGIDPVALLRSGVADEPASQIGWSVGALGLLVLWLGAVALTVRVRNLPLLRLHAVLAVALVLAVVSAARVHGLLWYYLFLWTKGLAVLLLIALAWSALAVLGHRIGPTAGRRLPAVALVAAATVALAASLVASVDNRGAEPSSADLGLTLNRAAGATIDELAAGSVPGGGTDGRYVVRWTDPVTIGSQGVGLLLELERAGFTVGVDRPYGVGATLHRVLDEAEADAVVHLATGPAIEIVATRPDAVQVAYVDGRTDDQRAEFDRLEATAHRRLVEIGRRDLADEWRSNLFTTVLDPEVPEDIQEQMRAAFDIGVPVAVFVYPAGRT